MPPDMAVVSDQYIILLQFARRKMNVVLISRSYDDLVNIISELRM